MVKKLRSILRVLPLFASVLYLSGCSSSSPKIEDISFSVVFRYDDFENPPEQFINAFAEVSSQVQRASKITIRYNETGLEWFTQEPRKLSTNPKPMTGSRSFAGYSRFYPEEGKWFPTGRYTFTYTDYNNKSEDINFYVTYPAFLTDSRAGDFPSLITSQYETYYAVYGEDSLLYYGESPEDWSNDQNILKNYGNAKYYRMCYKFNGNVICMMPAVQLAD